MTTALERNQPSTVTWVGLGLALVGVPALSLLELSSLASSKSAQFLVSDLIKWAVALGVLAVVVYGERASLGSIGLRWPSVGDLLIGLGIGLAAVVGGLVATGAAISIFDLVPPSVASAFGALPWEQRVVIILTAVVTEEILWRGYPMERLAQLTGHMGIAAALSGAVFVAVHYPAWGLVGAIPQVAFTVALVGLYAWRRQLVACMAAHLAINVAMLLVLPEVLGSLS